MRVEKGLPYVKGAGPQGLRNCRHPSKKHAEISWQKQIAILRVGCATGVRTRAGGGMPSTGCKASGENEKISGGKMYFPNRYFYRFHCARGDVSIRFLTLHAEAILFDAIVCRKMGPGPMALV